MCVCVCVLCVQQELYFQYTFDSICEIAFGLKVGTLRQPLSQSLFTTDAINTPTTSVVAAEGTKQQKNALFAKVCQSMPLVDFENASEEEMGETSATVRCFL